MSEKRAINLKVNGREYSVEAEPRVHLADILREELRLTGTHIGCEHGVCGACTIIVDGKAVRSCLMLAVQADGSEVETIEGLSDGDELHPLQEAFRNNHALQCGFCTSGMIMSLTAYLKAHPKADANQIRSAISGNICRCTGYQGIVEAGLEAAPKLTAKEGGK